MVRGPRKVISAITSVLVVGWLLVGFTGDWLGAGDIWVVALVVVLSLVSLALLA